MKFFFGAALAKPEVNSGPIILMCSPKVCFTHESKEEERQTQIPSFVQLSLLCALSHLQ